MRTKTISQLFIRQDLLREIARQRPSATRIAGLYARNQLGRKVKKGERGIRVLAPVIGIRRKKDSEAEKDIRTRTFTK